jgi:hypothetical protein
MDPANNLE